MSGDEQWKGNSTFSRNKSCLTSELEGRERIAELTESVFSLQNYIRVLKAEIAGLRADAMMSRH